MKIYNAKKIEKDFILDGDIYKSEWENADKVLLENNLKTGELTENAYFKCMYSNEKIYLAFECEDKHIVANYFNRNENLYDEDVVEFFIGLDNDEKRYLELEYNINNAIFSSIILNDNLKLTREYSIDDFTKCKAVKTNTGYNVEVSIDIDYLNGLFKNDFEVDTLYMFNAYRINLMADGGVEYNALCPTKPDKPDFSFHLSDRFGKIKFC